MCLRLAVQKEMELISSTLQLLFGGSDLISTAGRWLHTGTLKEMIKGKCNIYHVSAPQLWIQTSVRTDPWVKHVSVIADSAWVPSCPLQGRLSLGGRRLLIQQGRLLLLQPYF